jgi:hypothetical protein
MPHPLLVSDITSRSLASVTRCFKSGNTPKSIEVMKAEVRQIAREVALWQLSGEVKARIFLRPMEELLVNHYGAHNGRRLYWSFFDGFWLQSWSETLLESGPKVDQNAEPEIERRATG